jgi:hypothetical protein
MLTCESRRYRFTKSPIGPTENVSEEGIANIREKVVIERVLLSDIEARFFLRRRCRRAVLFIRDEDHLAVTRLDPEPHAGLLRALQDGGDLLLGDGERLVA